MNSDIIKGKWTQMKGSVKKAWGELTDDEIDQIDGDRQKLSGKLQERYGWAKNDAERRIDEFAREYDDRNTTVV